MLLLTILLVNSNLFSQPANDECADAINIASIEAYCSGAEEFTTADATTSAGFGIPIFCFPAWDGNQNDVWFTFSTTASVINVTIDVIGLTMEQPQIAVYRGDCTGFAELTCVQADAGTNNTTLDVLALDPSETYYIRINAATTGSDGTFQLCIDEFSSELISNATVGNCTGTLYDTGGPDDNYGAFESFEYSICPSEPHGCISLNLVSYDIEPIFDNLSIYDGADADAPLIASIDGIAENEFYNIPTTECVTLTFTSDGGAQRAGFELTWTCSLTCPTPPPDFQTCSGTFYDSGGPDDNYSDSEEITTIICPHPDSTNSCVYVNFTEFEVEDGFDDLSIYDGPTADGLLIGLFTGTDGPGLVFSSDSCITVVFDSDGFATDPGWVAEITCLPCGTPPPCIGLTPTCDLPDACDIACDLGTLDAPTPCPFTVPVTQSFCLDNTGASPAMPYIAQAACIDGNDMPDPAADIWYSFQASSNEVTFNITSFLNAASVALYQAGTSCETLVPLACNNSTDGGVTLFVEGIQPGDTYFLQISGEDASDTGEINLDITASINCDVPVIFTLDCGDALFTDSGGESDDYQSGENIQTIICPQPDSVGQCVLLNFLSFDVEDGFDDLFIYDGQDTNAPLIGEYTGTDSPSIVIASDSCLTVVFQSDGSVTSSGWVAEILCVECGTIPPCLGFTPECDLPNNCEIACSLDTLNSPTPCPSTNPASQSFCFTNVDATASMPYITQTDCSIGDTMATPAADVWYSFVASSNQLNITVQSQLTNVNVGLYQGDVCDMLTPIDCFSSENGNAVLFAAGIQIGGTYHLQISGGDENDTGEINVEIESSTDCSVPIQAQLTCADSLFTDTGGIADDYSSGELIVTTICPEPDDTTCVLLNFIAFQLENGFDDLFIYDGENTDASLIDEYTGTESPGAVIASGGCLTILFNSDGGTNGSGWIAEILCVECGTIPPCLGETLTCDLPDDCSDACDLGTLNSPTPCPGSIGVAQSFCINNIDATANPLFEGQVGCQDGTDVPSPAADVWYRFVASSNQLTIDIQSELSAASIGLYQGSSCGNLLPFACNNSETGNVDLFAVGIQPDSTYYVQISGADENDQGEINLIIESSNNCNFCVITAGLTAMPTPVNNAYPPSDTVTFCFSVTEWSQTAANWFHAVVPEFGPGWDLSTLTPTVIANSCDFAGEWLWQESITGTSNVSSNVGTVGPGFVYDSDLGGPLDGNGENNFGDNCSGELGQWEFCWQIAVSEDCTGDPGSLNMTVDTYGDSETGSWDSAACEEDVVYSLGLVTCTACTSPMVSSVATPPDCAGNGGEIELTVTGGEEPYDYAWDAPDIGDTANATGLADGMYTVTVTEAGGCSETVQITIDSPNLPIATAQIVGGNCDGGTGGEISVIGTNGTAPYQYSINDGMTYQADSIFTDLPQGTYNIAVQDAIGCIGTTIATIIIGNSPSIDDVQITNASCDAEDGTIFLVVSGGTAPYEYSLDGDTFQSDNIFENLSGDTYEIIVQDSLGCEIDSLVVLTQLGAPVLSDIQVTNPTCGDSNGSVNIFAEGGTTPYTYSLDGMSFQAAAAFPNLTAGVYTVVVRDAEGCDALMDIELTTDGIAVISNVETSDITVCNGNDGSISISVNGGTAPYEYSISNGMTYQATGDFNDLIADTYNVVIRDANGCIDTQSVELIEPTDEPEITNIATMDANCGATDGSIEITIDELVPPYEYSIDGGMTFQGSNSFENLPAGTYDIVIQDFRGCETSDAVTIGQTADLSPEIILDGSPTICPDESVSLYAGEYATYEWSTGDTGSIISASSADVYIVTVTDDDGCTGTASQTILEVNPFTIDAGSDQEVEIGTDYTVTGESSTDDSEYTWSGDNGFIFEGSTFTITADEFGTIVYTLTVTSEGCTVTDEVTVTIRDLEIPEMPNVFSPNNDDLNDSFGVPESISDNVTTFRVFNRWGEMVHDNNIARWDGRFRGKEQSQDVYTYYIVIERFNNDPIQLTGDVLLMR